MFVIFLVGMLKWNYNTDRVYVFVKSAGILLNIPSHGAQL